MLLVAGGFTLIGTAPKAGCASGSFAQTGTTSVVLPCYSDLAVLYGTEQLEHGRFPYVNRCSPSERPCDEYPVVTMLAMWVAARTGGTVAGYGGFFWTNVALMLVGAGICVWVLERMGARTAMFAAAPALALYATLNWDLIAVAAATIATYFVVTRRSLATGLWLGFGAAAKLYPALLALPFSVQRSRDDSTRESVRLVISMIGAWLAINVGFILAAPRSWFEVFRFNAARGADFESIWTGLCQVGVCLSAPVLNVAVPILFVATSAIVWRRVMRTHPETPPWMMGFPLLVILIVTGKYWSPQYALWLLPWFALSRVRTSVWLSYQLAEVLEYFARSAFMTGPTRGLSLGALSVVVAFRALMLVRCLVVWMRDPRPSITMAERVPAGDPTPQLMA
jgi:uncharacterized membrane protein